MIPVPSNVRIWLAAGHTDMRKGMTGLALLVQEHLKRDPHVGDVYVFRGRRGDLVKIVWHDGVGLSLYAKRLDHGRFIWPMTAGGPIALSAGQLGYCSKGWTGEIPDRHGGRRAPDRQEKSASRLHFGAPQAGDSMIPSSAWRPIPRLLLTRSPR